MLQSHSKTVVISGNLTVYWNALQAQEPVYVLRSGDGASVIDAILS